MVYEKACEKALKLISLFLYPPVRLEIDSAGGGIAAAL